jgi:hypothetical protein
MSKASFKIAFDGPALKEGRMDVRDLAPALLSLGRVIEASNRALNGPEHPVKIEAVATGIGSFEVGIDVVMPLWESMRAILTSSDVDAAWKLLEIIGFVGGPTSLIVLLRMLRGKRVASATRDANGQIIIRIPIEDGGETSIAVPADVLHLYQEVAVQRELGSLLDTLKKEAIDTITFYPKESSKASVEPVVLTKEDTDIAQTSEPAPETVIDMTQRMAVSIRSLAFQEGNKWRLYDGQNVITATIEDEDFLDKVDKSLARFAKGDILICLVRTVQKQSAEGLKSEHTVLKVEEHKPAPTQLSINFDPPLPKEK